MDLFLCGWVLVCLGVFVCLCVCVCVCMCGCVCVFFFDSDKITQVLQLHDSGTEFSCDHLT